MANFGFFFSVECCDPLPEDLSDPDLGDTTSGIDITCRCFSFIANPDEWTLLVSLGFLDENFAYLAIDSLEFGVRLCGVLFPLFLSDSRLR